jgi:hypothetical protein
VRFDEAHEETKAYENHDMNILECWVIRLYIPDCTWILNCHITLGVGRALKLDKEPEEQNDYELT